VRLSDHHVDLVQLVNGHHIPGQRRRSHTPMLPPAPDSHVSCPECDRAGSRRRQREAIKSVASKLGISNHLAARLGGSAMLAA
jgi:hypothetical protein